MKKVKISKNVIRANKSMMVLFRLLQTSIQRPKRRIMLSNFFAKVPVGDSPWMNDKSQTNESVFYKIVNKLFLVILFDNISVNRYNGCKGRWIIMTIQEILKEKNMSVYKLSKISTVPYATCNDIVNGKLIQLFSKEDYQQYVLLHLQVKTAPLHSLYDLLC